MQKVLILICFTVVLSITNTFAQDSTKVNIGIDLQGLTIHIADGYNRTNGMQLSPIISAQLDRIKLSTGPLFSIKNALDNNNLGATGFLLAVDLQLNSTMKKLNYGIEYVLTWQRFINTTTKHYNKGNYSLTNTFGYYVNYNLNKNWIITQGLGIGTGYGTTNEIEKKGYAYKGTAIYFKLGLEYKF